MIEIFRKLNVKPARGASRNVRIGGKIAVNLEGVSVNSDDQLRDVKRLGLAKTGFTTTASQSANNNFLA